MLEKPKKRGGALLFPFLPKIRVSRAWGFPRCGGVPEGHWGVFFILGVAEWRINTPSSGKFTAFGSFLRLLYFI